MSPVGKPTSKSRKSWIALTHTAFHEAGHAVAALQFNIRVKRVTIEAPDEWTLGMVKHARSVDWETADARLEARGLREIVVALSGGEAERFVKGRYDHTAARSDYNAAADYASTMCAGMPAETNALLRYAELRTRRLVASEAWQIPIRAMAAALLEKKTLTGADAREVFYRAFR